MFVCVVVVAFGLMDLLVLVVVIGMLSDAPSWLIGGYCFVCCFDYCLCLLLCLASVWC